jgi:hypothetical protein
VTYRVGRHWGVTIVREGSGVQSWDDDDHPEDQLVAVVVNGDRDLAERICALLNGDPCTRVGLHNCAGEWRNHDRDGGRP